jgi:hypothetical protein
MKYWHAPAELQILFWSLAEELGRKARGDAASPSRQQISFRSDGAALIMLSRIGNDAQTAGQSPSWNLVVSYHEHFE